MSERTGKQRARSGHVAKETVVLKYPSSRTPVISTLHTTTFLAATLILWMPQPPHTVGKLTLSSVSLPWPFKLHICTIKKKKNHTQKKVLYSNIQFPRLRLQAHNVGEKYWEKLLVFSHFWFLLGRQSPLSHPSGNHPPPPGPQTPASAEEKYSELLKQWISIMWNIHTGSKMLLYIPEHLPKNI